MIVSGKLTISASSTSEYSNQSTLALIRQSWRRSPREPDPQLSPSSHLFPSSRHLFSVSVSFFSSSVSVSVSELSYTLHHKETPTVFPSIHCLCSLPLPRTSPLLPSLCAPFPVHPFLFTPKKFPGYSLHAPFFPICVILPSFFSHLAFQVLPNFFTLPCLPFHASLKLPNVPKE